MAHRAEKMISLVLALSQIFATSIVRDTTNRHVDIPVTYEDPQPNVNFPKKRHTRKSQRDQLTLSQVPLIESSSSSNQASHSEKLEFPAFVFFLFPNWGIKLNRKT